MQKIYKNIITAPFLATLVGGLLLMLLMLPKNAVAQQSLDLTVSPPIGYLKVAPGTKQSHTISIKNTGESLIEVSPEIVDFSLDAETGRPVLADSHTFPYFTMPDSSLKPIAIEPDQVAQLQLSIEPPASAQDQEFPLSILFAANTDAAHPGQTKVSGAVASNLVILVSDKNNLEKKLVVSDFGAPKITDSFRGLTASPILKNERFSTAAASGSAKLASWTGKIIGEYQIYPDNILGLNSRRIRALDPESNDTPRPVAFTYSSPFLLGPYQFTIELDNNGQREQFTQTIIAIPFSIFAAGVIGAVVGLIYWLKTRQDNQITI